MAVLRKDDSVKLERLTAIDNQPLHMNAVRTRGNGASKVIASGQHNRKVVQKPMSTNVEQRMSHEVKIISVWKMKRAKRKKENKKKNWKYKEKSFNMKTSTEMKREKGKWRRDERAIEKKEKRKRS